jgi:hypothetical protein
VHSANEVNRLSGVLGHYPNLRKLAIQYIDTDTALDPLLVRGLSDLTLLEVRHILSVSSGPTILSRALHDRLLNATLNYHSSHLRSLALRCSMPLHPSTFRRVRDTVTRLRNIEFTGSIGIDLRSVLSEPQRWACADHLQHIRLAQCRGIHAAIFSNQLAAGIFGHPRTVRLAFCGDRSDQENLPRAPRWNIPSLELLELNNFTPWAMEYLGQIHTKVVRLKKTWHRGCGQLVEALKRRCDVSRGVGP